MHKPGHYSNYQALLGTYSAKKNKGGKVTRNKNKQKMQVGTGRSGNQLPKYNIKSSPYLESGHGGSANLDLHKRVAGTTNRNVNKIASRSRFDLTTRKDRKTGMLTDTPRPASEIDLVSKDSSSSYRNITEKYQKERYSQYLKDAKNKKIDISFKGFLKDLKSKGDKDVKKFKDTVKDVVKSTHESRTKTDTNLKSSTDDKMIEISITKGYTEKTKKQKKSFKPYSQKPKTRYGSKVLGASGVGSGDHSRKRSAGPNATVGSAIDVNKKHLKSRSRMTESKSSGYQGKGPYTGGARPAGFMDAVNRQRLHRNSPYRKK